MIPGTSPNRYQPFESGSERGPSLRSGRVGSSSKRRNDSRIAIHFRDIDWPGAGLGAVDGHVVQRLPPWLRKKIKTHGWGTGRFPHDTPLKKRPLCEVALCCQRIHLLSAGFEMAAYASYGTRCCTLPNTRFAKSSCPGVGFSRNLTTSA